jgi:hypothetical protein
VAELPLLEVAASNDGPAAAPTVKAAKRKLFPSPVAGTTDLAEDLASDADDATAAATITTTTDTDSAGGWDPWAALPRTEEQKQQKRQQRRKTKSHAKATNQSKEVPTGDGIVDEKKSGVSGSIFGSLSKLKSTVRPNMSNLSVRAKGMTSFIFGSGRESGASGSGLATAKERSGSGTTTTTTTTTTATATATTTSGKATSGDVTSGDATSSSLTSVKVAASGNGSEAKAKANPKAKAKASSSSGPADAATRPDPDGGALASSPSSPAALTEGSTDTETVQALVESGGTASPPTAQKGPPPPPSPQHQQQRSGTSTPPLARNSRRQRSKYAALLAGIDSITNQRGGALAPTSTAVGTTQTALSLVAGEGVAKAELLDLVARYQAEVADLESAAYMQMARVAVQIVRVTEVAP